MGRETRRETPAALLSNRPHVYKIFMKPLEGGGIILCAYLYQASFHLERSLSMFSRFSVRKPLTVLVGVVIAIVLGVEIGRAHV